VVEVRKTALGVVRLERQGGRRVALASAASSDLPPGALDLSLTEAGIRDREAVGLVLRGLLERAGALRDGVAALVLPDAVGRLTVLPARDLLGKRGAELQDMTRFRLRRSVPFEVRDAQIAVDLPPRGGPDAAVVVAVFKPVLEAFEGLLEAQGLRPGIVELSSLSLLSLLEPADGDLLLINWDEGYASLVLARDGVPLLVRTLSEAAAAPEALAAEISSTLLYYRDRLGGPGLARAFVRSTILPASDAAALFTEPLGFAPVPLDPWAPFGGGDPHAGQALASALAVAGRRAERRAA